MTHYNRFFESCQADLSNFWNFFYINNIFLTRAHAQLRVYACDMCIKLINIRYFMNIMHILFRFCQLFIFFWIFYFFRTLNLSPSVFIIFSNFSIFLIISSAFRLLFSDFPYHFNYFLICKSRFARPMFFQPLFLILAFPFDVWARPSLRAFNYPLIYTFSF